MTENVEISNPMYLREDIDDDGDNFTLDSIKVSYILCLVNFPSVFMFCSQTN